MKIISRVKNVKHLTRYLCWLPGYGGKDRDRWNRVNSVNKWNSHLETLPSSYMFLGYARLSISMLLTFRFDFTSSKCPNEHCSPYPCPPPTNRPTSTLLKLIALAERFRSLMRTDCLVACWHPNDSHHTNARHHEEPSHGDHARRETQVDPQDTRRQGGGHGMVHVPD